MSAVMSIELALDDAQPRNDMVIDTAQARLSSRGVNRGASGRYDFYQVVILIR